ncbi:MAG: RiPP maturation radical SAM protein 1 [bacterium]|nr:RiPP maturation radical SAM protein 1 [bacterium]
MPEILFILPPFFTGGMPSIVLSTLKSILKNENINSEILYANLLLKKKIDIRFYEELSFLYNHYELVEYIFASHAFPVLYDKHAEYDSILKRNNKALYEKINETRDQLGNYLETLKDIIVKKSPKIIWINSFVKQVTASICISNAVKESSPESTVVVSGHSCLFPMGDELLRIAPAIDYIFSGEPEEKIVSFCKTRLEGAGELKARYPHEIIQCPPVSDINQFPAPDFSDYLDQSDKLWFFNKSICFEGSRGCWQGYKSHCLFCGHKEEYIHYRRKSPEKALSEINYLIKKYNPEYIFAVDPIMPMEFPGTVFQHLEKTKKLKNFFYEISPQLNLSQLSILKDKGVNSCQPGIESFSTAHLKILGKLTSAPNNIRFLRDCRTIGIEPYWNFLFGIPGEKENEYVDMINFIPFLHHFKPPAKIRALIIQRFSPLYEQYQKYNIKNLRPPEAYYYIFPDEADIGKLALFFIGEYKKAFENRELEKDFFEAIEKWQNLWKDRNAIPELKIIPGKEDDRQYLIIDSRESSVVKQVPVSKDQYEILNFLRLPVPEADVQKFVGELLCEQVFTELLTNNFIIKIDYCYLSLVVDKTTELL